MLAPGGAPHLVPGLQVPLQRLLGELADPQLAVLAGHHDAGPPEAHCHFHPGPGLPRGAGPNRCLAPGHSPSVGGREADTTLSRAWGPTAAPLQPHGRPRAGTRARRRGDAEGRPGAGGDSTRQSETAGAARPGPALPLAVALATVAGPAPGPGLEWAAAAARGARVGRKLLRRLPTPPTRAALWAPSARGPAWARLLKGPRRSRATERTEALHQALGCPD